jgi:hypothetical protein
MAVDNILAYLNGSPKNVLNPDALKTSGQAAHTM